MTTYSHQINFKNLIFFSLLYLGALGFLYLVPSPLAASLSLKESGVPALSDERDARPAAPPPDIGTERAVRSLTYIIQ